MELILEVKGAAMDASPSFTNCAFSCSSISFIICCSCICARLTRSKRGSIRSPWRETSRLLRSLLFSSCSLAFSSVFFDLDDDSGMCDKIATPNKHNNFVRQIFIQFITKNQFYQFYHQFRGMSKELLNCCKIEI